MQPAISTAPSAYPGSLLTFPFTTIPTSVSYKVSDIISSEHRSESIGGLEYLTPLRIQKSLEIVSFIAFTARQIGSGVTSPLIKTNPVQGPQSQGALGNCPFCHVIPSARACLAPFQPHYPFGWRNTTFGAKVFVCRVCRYGGSTGEPITFAAIAGTPFIVLRTSRKLAVVRESRGRA